MFINELNHGDPCREPVMWRRALSPPTSLSRTKCCWGERGWVQGVMRAEAVFKGADPWGGERGGRDSRFCYLPRGAARLTFYLSVQAWQCGPENYRKFTHASTQSCIYARAHRLIVLLTTRKITSPGQRKTWEMVITGKGTWPKKNVLSACRWVFNGWLSG